MAKERMITRTVKVTEAAVMAVDIKSAQVVKALLKINGDFDDDKSLLIALQSAYDTDQFKTVAVTDYTTSELLYGMTEREFMSNAVLLPPRKNYGETAETVED